ncbi:MAG: PQQ-dependent sugar dehydrogenase [Phycisphaerales bacterium]|nr:PQQ-dependent sugar dehydrogenase [Phycisphaerales bacterium]
MHSATALVAALGLALAASAQVRPGDATIELEPVATGLTSPVFATGAGDGSGRLFIVEQTGRIRILQNGVLLPIPFLDVSADMPALNPGYDERGLLGLAFHPDFESNGRFFVRYSRPRAGQPTDPCFGTSRGCHEEVLAEFSCPIGSNVANPGGVILLRVDKPEFNHNAGHVEFGPDGYLYMSMGDGGGANDGLHLPTLPHGPGGNGQNIGVLLGKMLRIDVDSGPPYASPPDNPFVGVDGRDEVYAYGFRNPYRFTFDDGRLIVADVGQDMFEEVDIVVKGGNYGWVKREALHCFDPFNPTTPPASCAVAGLIDPVAEYRHTEGISITGGFVYRGSRSPALTGAYVFGDFSRAFTPARGRLFYIRTAGDLSDIREFRLGRDARDLNRYVKGFGRDDDGEVYLCSTTILGPSGASGIVSRIVGACYADCNGDERLDLADMGCFQTRFALGLPGADCNRDGVLNLSDFGCYQTGYTLGCP